MVLMVDIPTLAAPLRRAGAERCLAGRADRPGLDTSARLATR